MKSPNRPPKSVGAPMPAQPVTTPLARLREWQGMADGAYSANTLRAQKADGAIFQAFCEGRGESFLPADPKTIRAFIEHGALRKELTQCLRTGRAQRRPLGRPAGTGEL